MSAQSTMLSTLASAYSRTAKSACETPKKALPSASTFAREPVAATSGRPTLALPLLDAAVAAWCEKLYEKLDEPLGGGKGGGAVAGRRRRS